MYTNVIETDLMNKYNDIHEACGLTSTDETNSKGRLSDLCRVGLGYWLTKINVIDYGNMSICGTKQ